MKNIKVLAVASVASIITGFSLGTVASVVNSTPSHTYENRGITKQIVQEHFSRYDATPEGKREAFTSLLTGFYSECLTSTELEKEVNTMVDESLTNSVPTITKKVAQSCYGYKNIDDTKIVELDGIIWHVAG
ncbi:hypothetical protein [Vreelandella neptunia]|uniref:Uncharacterized protein n=1 Tax=Vreelandella neptunia TaxID=115551 RepID=A0ABS9S9S6_9GAMM|nr:hypothetical protein [Halomonas neptunia]MCH4812859.1 hypothetical protein [Halomonas neptunia]